VSGPGTVIFAGGGAWLPRRNGGSREGGNSAGGGSPGGGGILGDEALVLSEPCRILVATTPEDVRGLLDEVESEQRQGRYVAGYLAYEAGAAFDLTVQKPASDALPLAWMAVYPEESATVVAATSWKRHLDTVDVSDVARALAKVKPELSVSRDEYIESIGRVREFIAAGDTYQVNYTVRGRYDLAPAGARAAGAAPAQAISPLEYFFALAIRQPVPYAAYLDIGEAQIISLSPEMFLRREGRHLESRPMKGTRPRGTTHAEDVALAYELVESEKERAENLMIVDMVRNDLGRVCRAGSVSVPTLYAIEPYRTVWQMVSTVTGDVNPRSGLGEIMQAVFPGASITGAPKHHTMEIIAALETEPRDVYTGTVGCFSPGGDFTCNIAIRTIIHRQGHCKLGTGSGVVWDADAPAEYDETLVKAAFATPPSGDLWRPDPAARLRAAVRPPIRIPGVSSLARTLHPADELRLFETILLEAREGDATIEAPMDLAGLSPSLVLCDSAVLARYVFLDDHLDRLAASAKELGFPFDREAALDLLLGLARLSPGSVVVHVELDADGGLSQSTRSAPTWNAPLPRAGTQRAGAAGAFRSITMMVSPFRTDPDDPFLRHKTTTRGFYNREHRRAVHDGCFDALFLNRLDRVTEGAITNVFARFGDLWVTPPLGDGLLPGIWRGRYLARTGAAEVSLTLDELMDADEIVVGNSVRGGVSVGRLIADPVVF
jgi:para-aminobenzoate synthetase/4-amino-4-deoxychorismate lyase